MRKFINNLGLVAIALIAAVVIHSSLKTDYSTTISYEKIQEIKPVVIIDHGTLQNDKQAYEAVSDITNLIHQLGPFAAMFKGQSFNVLIESNGGRVDLGYKIITHLNTLKARTGIKFKCYVKTAASMAFTLYLSICDEKIGLEGLVLMQHPVKYNNGARTVKTKIDDLDINATEARILKVPEKEWRKLSKEDGDHYFTKEEIKKYKLVDSHE